MVIFASLIVVAHTAGNRGGDLVEPMANGLSLSIIFLIGASLMDGDLTYEPGLTVFRLTLPAPYDSSAPTPQHHSDPVAHVE